MASLYTLVPTHRNVNHTTSEIPKGQTHHDHEPAEKVDTAGGGIQPVQKSSSRGIKARWKRFSIFITDSWFVEVASLLASISLLVGLAILFKVFHGKPITDYHASLSFATIIAIISKAVQVALMLPVASSIGQLGWIHFRKPRVLLDLQRFDAASRGLKGSFQLLFLVPSFCAVLGTLIMVPALGMEAAAQQCLETSPTEYIPLLVDIFYLPEFAGTGGTVTDGIRDAGLSAMTSKHLVAGGDVPPSYKSQPVLPQTLEYSCTGSGCTPAPYTTLSFCSRCEDVTGDLTQYEDFCDSTDDSNEFCGVQLLHGAGLNYSDQVLSMSTTPVTYSSEPLWKGELYLVDFTVVERILPVAASNYVQPLNYAAHSCSILLCANIYQLQISSADTVGSGATERSLATFLQASWGDYQISEATINGYQVTTPSGSTHGSVTGLGIDNSSIQYLGKYFTSLFKGVATMDSAFGYGSNNSDPVSLAAAYGQQPSGSGFWNTIAYTLSGYGYTDQEDINTQFNALFADIATSMGNWFRDFYTTQDDGTQGQPGLINLLTPSKYRIRWAWLIRVRLLRRMSRRAHFEYRGEFAQLVSIHQHHQGQPLRSEYVESCELWYIYD